MVYSEDDLNERLKYLEREELISLIVRLYKRYPEVHSEVNRTAVTRDDDRTVLENLEKYSPGECKAALSAYVKSTRDREEKVLRYFEFVEQVLEKRKALDFRFISVASAAFGKAMDLMAKDRKLWDEMLDRSYDIAGVFYEMEGAVPYKAVEYYMRVKRSFERESST